MWRKYLLLLAVVPFIHGVKESKIINLAKIAETINNDPDSTWKASDYGWGKITEEEAKARLGLKLTKEQELLMKSQQHINETDENLADKLKLGAWINWLPESYDARQEFSNCKSIGMIRDQSNCGSCWAVSGASVLSDRFCIATHGKFNDHLSSHYTMACSEDNYGCQGGYLDDLWDFYYWYGVRTGDEYETDKGCQPYGIRPCGYPKKLACSRDLALTPKCYTKSCTNEWHTESDLERFYYVRDYYQVGEFLSLFNEFKIKLEIYENGPVQAGYFVYRDFLTYKSGVYEHKFRWFDFPLGGHAVKIIGWGVEKGVKYWLVANSWSEEWGENGLFKIVRGKNNCFIESMVYAGIPEF